MINFKQLLKDKNQLRLFFYDLIRFYLGIGLFLKGLQFMTQPKILEFWIKMTQISGFSKFLIYYVVFAHICGGLFLSIGIGTRLAAIAQIPVLLGAVFFVHSKEGLFTYSHNLEFTIFILFLLIIYIFSGAGRYSIDYFLKKEFSKKNT
tara:strand:+ start:342 stop:788 length:447 start_codon:yes stop_codon:yes gene_type:complete